MGRFEFTRYEAVDSTGEIHGLGREYFPPRRPREWYKTEGFREEAICLEATGRSYRQTSAHLNRFRRQWQGGTPVMTLQDSARKEGAQVLDFLEHQSQAVFKAQGFDEHGQPQAASLAQARKGMDRRLRRKALEAGLEAVVEQMQAREMPSPQIEAVSSAATRAIYEQPPHCTYLHVDDVSVKEQKAHRERPTPSPKTAVFSDTSEPSSSTSRPKVDNTIARLEHQGQRFTLSGSGVLAVLRFALAFLLSNGLLSGRLHIFTDGYRGLQNAVIAFFCLASASVGVIGLVPCGEKIQRRFESSLPGEGVTQSASAPLDAFVMVWLSERSAGLPRRDSGHGPQRPRCHHPAGQLLGAQ